MQLMNPCRDTRQDDTIRHETTYGYDLEKERRKKERERERKANHQNINNHAKQTNTRLKGDLYRRY